MKLNPSLHNKHTLEITSYYLQLSFKLVFWLAGVAGMTFARVSHAVPSDFKALSSAQHLFLSLGTE